MCLFLGCMSPDRTTKRMPAWSEVVQREAPSTHCSLPGLHLYRGRDSQQNTALPSTHALQDIIWTLRKDGWEWKKNEEKKSRSCYTKISGSSNCMLIKKGRGEEPVTCLPLPSPHTHTQREMSLTFRTKCSLWNGSRFQNLKELKIVFAIHLKN